MSSTSSKGRVHPASGLYLFFSRRKPLLFALLLLLIVPGALALSTLKIREDISAMIPDDPALASEMELLSKSPFSRNVLITLKAGPEVSVELLAQTASGLTKVLKPPTFSKAISGPDQASASMLLPWLAGASPNLTTASDAEAIAALAQEKNIAETMRLKFEKLLSPEGVAEKQLIRTDPIGLCDVFLPKLRGLAMFSKMRVVNGQFVSDDGKNALIIAETPIPITDSARSAEMLAELDRLFKEVLPQGVKAAVVSGHAYAAANAATIQRDLKIIISVSTVAIALIILFFLKHWRAVFVLLMPAAAICAATAVVAAVYETASALTLGFGAVLLGVSTDYGIHVYLTMSRGREPPEKLVAGVWRPILFGAATTLGAFGLLLFSDLPGQRQLAVFSLAGIIGSVVISLIAVPHLTPLSPNACQQDDGSLPVNGRPRGAAPTTTTALSPFKISRLGGIFILAAVMVFGVWGGSLLRIDGDLRNIGATPPELVRAENNLRQVWGDARSRAIIAAQGSDLQSALEANDKLYGFLSKNFPGASISGIAPIFPSFSTQGANYGRWKALWNEKGRAERTKKAVSAQGAALGFASDAFEPFFQLLDNRPQPVDLESLKAIGLDSAVNSLMSFNGDSVRILSLVPDEPEIISSIRDWTKGSRTYLIASQIQFKHRLASLVKRDFVRFFAAAFAATVFLLAVLYRDLKNVVLAMVPVIAGLAIMCGVMGFMGAKLNLFHAAAMILLIGVGVDYGIFIVSRPSDPSTRLAVFASGLTTLAGFGSLALARHPALHSMGITVLLGITGAIWAALTIVPAFVETEPKVVRP